jgi:hypothetical protein
MNNGYNKFRQSVNNNHVFRKANNTLSQINSFALPTLSTASLIQPALAPVFGTTIAALKGMQTITNNLKTTKI